MLTYILKSIYEHAAIAIICMHVYILQCIETGQSIVSISHGNYRERVVFTVKTYFYLLVRYYIILFTAPLTENTFYILIPFHIKNSLNRKRIRRNK